MPWSTSLFLWLKCKCNSVSHHTCAQANIHCISICSSASVIFDASTSSPFFSLCKLLKKELCKQNRKFVATLSFNIRVPKFWPFCSWNHGDHQQGTASRGPSSRYHWLVPDRKAVSLPTLRLKHNISGSAELWLINLKSMAQLFLKFPSGDGIRMLVVVYGLVM